MAKDEWKIKKPDGISMQQYINLTYKVVEQRGLESDEAYMYIYIG